jgi:hypothetical protein
MRGVLNDAVSIYFGDATLASALVARWCAGYKIETAEGVFRVRTDAPAPRTGRQCTGHPRGLQTANRRLPCWVCV